MGKVLYGIAWLALQLTKILNFFPSFIFFILFSIYFSLEFCIIWVAGEEGGCEGTGNEWN